MKKSVFKEVPDVVHNAILNALDSLEEDNVVSIRRRRGNKKQSNFRVPRMAAACLACFLIAGITVSAVGVVNLYRQRMEEMDKTEVEEYYSIALAGEANSLNRPYTKEERTRYEQLEQEYKTNGLFPESKLRYMTGGDDYDGVGVAVDTTSRTLYLPETTLTDEELLEIIDFNSKVANSIYQLNKERIINGGGWESRMELMDDAEVDEIYLITCSTREPTSGGFSRMLTADEQSRYDELNRRYEEEGLYTTSELSVIWKPEEYTGEGIAICVFDADYYLPERELSDEELLQIIDYIHKGRYCLSRIGQEVMMGLRDGYPPVADIE